MTQKPKRADSPLYNGKFFGSEEERIEYITNKCMKAWRYFSPEIVVIEGYSFGAKGSALSVLHELGGVMKNKLLQADAVYVVVPPTEIKKFATGSGGASKSDVLDAAQELWPECSSDDEADAFWMARYGRFNYANLVEAIS